MAAPKGNQYGKFKHAGNPRVFETPEQLWEAFEAYKKWVNENPWLKNEAVKSGQAAGTIMQVPTQRPLLFEGFASHAKTTVQTLANYESNEGVYKEFFEVSTRIRNEINRDNLEGGYVGAYDGALVARKLGIADRQNINADIKSNEAKISVSIDHSPVDLSLRPRMDGEKDGN